MSCRHGGDYAGEPETITCIRCPKPAVTYCGHVKDVSGQVILAGWCDEEHDAFAEESHNEGCLGQWVIGMGVRFTEPTPGETD